MEFIEIANLFEKLENTSKRLEKTLLLRDFFSKNPKTTPILFDCIAGNYQREIGKKSLGISIKTTIEVLSFVTQTSQKEIEKKFNKQGDIGLVAEEIIQNKKQNTLHTKKLQFQDILKAFNNISNKTGSKSNSFKKEELSNLFLKTNDKNEAKYLARFIIDDFRIGVSKGALKDAITHTIFPKINSLHTICQECGYINFSTQSCIKCRTKIDLQKQKELIEKSYTHHDCKIPKEVKNLKNYIPIRDEEQKIAYILRTTKNEDFITVNSPREIFNTFQNIIEKQYNILNSFQKLVEKCNKSKEECLNTQLELHRPILSMLGTRLENVNEIFETFKAPVFLDFKYDGLRVQIHNENGKVTLFSRNLENITNQFPEIIDFIKTNFPKQKFILDSECVGIDVNTNKYLPFQTLSRRILTKDVSSVQNIKIIVKAFDILYLDGETLIDKPFKQRREILENLFLNRELRQKKQI